jgi:hypothetical protein
LLLVDPKTLLTLPNWYIGGVAPGIGSEGAEAFRSVWGHDVDAGTIDRWHPPNLAHHGVTHVTDPPSFDGSCITSLTADANAVWVTLAPSVNLACKF